MDGLETGKMGRASLEVGNKGENALEDNIDGTTLGGGLATDDPAKCQGRVQDRWARGELSRRPAAGVQDRRPMAGGLAGHWQGWLTGLQSAESLWCWAAETANRVGSHGDHAFFWGLHAPCKNNQVSPSKS